MPTVKKYKHGGEHGNPFAMTKEEEDKATVDVLKGDKKFLAQKESERERGGNRKDKIGELAEHLAVR